MERGSFIIVGSSFAGMRPVTVRDSAGKRVLVGVAEAERHRWSEVSDKKEVFDFENKDVRPLLRFERMISSNNLIEGSSARVVSRS